MSVDLRVRTVLLVGIFSTLPACQATQPVAGKPARYESAPPKAAASAPATGGATALLLSTTQGRAGEVLAITATLKSGGASIAGTQNDIGYDPKQIAVVAKSNGKPDCAANPKLGKEGTAFSFLPQGCQAVIGAGCTSVRALVLSLSNVDAIPNASALYTCKVRISPQASPGAHTLSLSRVGFSSPAGQAIAGSGVAGAITVGK